MPKDDNKSFENSTIHNVRLDSHFTITHNITAENPNLSWGAKGLLWYILSRPHNWSIHVWQLSKIYEGPKKGGKRDAIQGLLKELRESGYINYTKSRDSKGKWVHRYDVYPLPMKNFQKMFSQQDNPAQEVPAQENPAVLTSTELPSTDLPNNDLPPLSPPKQTSLPKKKSLRSEEEDFSIYDCLKETTLNLKERKRLTSNYSEEQIQRALKISKTQPIKKSLMALLLNILNNPDNWDDELQENPMTLNQQRALRYNQNLSKLDAKLAKTNEKKIPEGLYFFIITKLGVEQISLKAQDFDKDMTEAERFIEKTKPHKGSEKP